MHSPFGPLVAKVASTQGGDIARADASLIALAPELLAFVERMACVGQNLIQPERFVLDARALLARVEGR